MNVILVDQDNLGDFVSISDALQPDEPLWRSRPYESVEHQLLSIGITADKIKVQRFMCHDSARSVGRLAAYVDHKVVDSRGQPIGQVGQFESIHDAAIAKALFQSAFTWFKEHGVCEVWGPIEGGAHRRHRLMTAGFDRAPFLLEPRNPPYYPTMFLENGFVPLHSWSCFDFTVNELKECLTGRSKFKRIAAHAGRRYELEFPDTGNAVSIAARLHPLLDRVWAGHIAYVPVDFTEFVELIKDWLNIVPQGYLSILVESGKGDVGMAMMYPDYCESDLITSLENHEPLTAHTFSVPTRLVLHTIAVTPEVRNTGAIALYYDRAISKMREDGYLDVIVALVDETFTIYKEMAAPTRRYSIYKRAIG